MKLLVTAVSLFIASFFLPFYLDGSGYECAVFCMLVWQGGWLVPTGFLAKLYLFSFTISHAMMILVPILLLTRLKHKKVPIGLITAQIILLTHGVSFLILAIAHDIKYRGNAYMGDATPDINIGYYIWLLSMIIMAVISLTKKDAGQPEEPASDGEAHP
jgi:hypothetical protein